ncbi:hypothetical protein ACOSQ4_011203 [Xanthoceras sorbifolium]
MQKLKLQSSSITETRRNLDVPIYGGGATSQMGAPVYNNFSPESNRRPGIPPSHPNNHPALPYSQMMMSSRNSNLNSKPRPSQYRSLSQPSVFDLLPPISPTNPLTHNRESPLSSVVVADRNLSNVSVEERAGNSHGLSVPSPVNIVNASMVGENLPPRKGHRRSISDTPLGFSAMIQSSPQLMPIRSRGVLDVPIPGRETSVSQKPIQLVKRESEWNDKDGKDNVEGMGERKLEGEFLDDLLSVYMNLDSIDTLNSSGTEDKDLDSRASGMKTNVGESSDNEVESGMNRNSMGLQGTSSNVSSERREGVKRSACGDIGPAARHYRSLSMDSYMGSFNFDDDTARLPLQTRVHQLSPGSPIDDKLAKLSFELNGEFSEAELTKILANDNLGEIALSDPKRVKRILANRESAARSKERKMRYMTELEQKVQALQTEADTLTSQIAFLQRDSAGLATENNELKFRLEAMEQHNHLKNALNDALLAEIARMKRPAGETSGEAHLASCTPQQLPINNQMLQRQRPRLNELNLYQLQQWYQRYQQLQQQHPQPNQVQPQPQNGEAAAPESK